MKTLKELMISGREVLPLIEGGKGVAVSTALTSGAWAAENAVGTISGVIPDVYDDNGEIVPMVIKSKTRRERFEEQVRHSIAGIISQAKLAHDISGGRGRIHVNVLWEQGGAQTIIQEALEGAKGLIHGITCGAGMPYKLGQLASAMKTFYYPIVSSGRAFRALWLRAYKSYADYLGGVVFEDPWKAGGHIGLSNGDDPDKPENPYGRVVELRQTMNSVGLNNVPIIIAGGVWYLREFQDYIDNPEVSPTAFQFGTRPLLTRESPVAKSWQKILLTLKKGEIAMQRFSPTGFMSSAIKNKFLTDLFDRSATAMPYRESPEGDFQHPILVGASKLYITQADQKRADDYMEAGRTVPLKTADNEIVFVTPKNQSDINRLRANCMGCISQCMFSGFTTHTETMTTGKTPDPRYFCIKDTLYRAAHEDDPDNNLVFVGANAMRFASDPLFKDGYLPTVKEFIARLLTGD